MNESKVSKLKIAALPCGAKTRKGAPCNAPAVTGRLRCRMHGGADGSGAPLGNKNAFKHGRFTKKAIADRKLVRELKKQAKEFFSLHAR